MPIGGTGKSKKQKGTLVGPSGTKQKPVSKQVGSISRGIRKTVDKIKEDMTQPLREGIPVDPYPKGSLTDKYKKKASSSKKSSSKNPLPKNPTLNDYLKRNMRPPTKGKKAPADYDVITKDMGYTKPTKKNPPRKIK